MQHSDALLIFLLASLSLVVGIQLIRGKWLMLIAGYNTMSKEKRATVNGKNLGKLVGCLLIWVVVLTTFNYFFPTSDTIITVLILLSVGFMLFYANTSEKFKS